MEFYYYSLIGLVYYIVVYLLSKKFKFKIIHGLWLPLGLNILFFSLFIYSSYTEPSGWTSLGYLIFFILALSILLMYLATWGIHSLVQYLIKKNQSN